MSPPVYIIDPRQMSHEDIVKAVQRIRYASKYLRNSRQTASVNGLAKAAGVSRKAVYRLAQNGRVAPETADKLRHALTSNGYGTKPVPDQG